MYTIKGFLGDTHTFEYHENLHSWMEGALHALYSFAINKDGQLWVGSTGKTYKEAVEILHTQYKEATGKDYSN